MNDWLAASGLSEWKALAKTLVMPPVPWLALLGTGLLLRARRPAAGALAVMVAVAALWLGSTEAFSRLLLRHLVQVPLPLPAAQLAQLRQAPHTAIVVLGGGRRPGRDYGGGETLNARSLERLRYGVWLSRQTGLPLGFSGGRGHGEGRLATEAGLAAEIARREFGATLRWTEDRSRDTAENARESVALLHASGIRRIVLVTHNYHMPRALANFARAAQPHGIAVVAAPTGTPVDEAIRPVDWLPSLLGVQNNWLAWHEWLGRQAGA